MGETGGGHKANGLGMGCETYNRMLHGHVKMQAVIAPVQSTWAGQSAGCGTVG